MMTPRESRCRPLQPDKAPTCTIDKHLFLLASVLTLVLLSACSPRDSPEAGGTEVDRNPRNSSGVTVFGDARLGVRF